MRRPEKLSDLISGSPEFDHESDHYPELKPIISKVLQEPDFPTGSVDRLEVSLHANGYATCRVWPARAVEPVGWTYANLALPVERPAGL